jgi:MFS family permease
LRQDLYHITTDGFYYCLMVGFAEVYFAKFIVALNLGEVASGLVMTLPLLLGAVLSVRGPQLLKRMGSYSRYNGTVATVQACALFPLAGCALLAPSVMPWLLSAGLAWVATLTIFALVTLYYFGALATMAPWTTVVGELVPGPIRANYNARRLRLLQGATLGALLLSGLIADGVAKAYAWMGWSESAGYIRADLVGFAISFTLGGLFRLGSAWHLFRYSTPKREPKHQDDVRALDFVTRFAHGNDGRFLLAALAGSFALQVSQPYTNPYMLTQLTFSGGLHAAIEKYVGSNAPYSLLLAAVYLGRILAFPVAGKLAQRTGGLTLMWVGGGLLVPLAMFWLVSPRFEWLLAGQVFTGAALACWELGVFLMNYEAIKPQERAAMMTYYAVANEGSKSGGSLLGAGVLEALGKTGSAYGAVFIVSAVARVGVLWLLLRVKKPPPGM